MDMDPGQNLLLILIRNPELGKCKTRLAAQVGDQAALDIYKFLLAHTLEVTKDLKVDKRVLYSREVLEDDIWDSKIYQKRLQRGEDLGERMEQAFKEGFRDGYYNIAIIGSDLYDLTQENLETAFGRFDSHDFVVGPAQDGGYYLLGMKSMKEELFRNKAWSTDRVLSDTLGDLKGETIALLPERNDVDLFEDIRDLEVFAPYIKHIKA